MKKNLPSLFIAFAVICLSFAVFSVFAAAETNASYEYSLGEDSAEITKYLGSDSVVSIPETIDGYPVTTIGAYAFEECAEITAVTVPESVTSIGLGAFRGCVNLSSAIINASITALPDQIFSGCHSLSSVYIPESVTSVGYNAFYACKSLQSFTIGSGITRIAQSAFSFCTSLSQFFVDEGNTSFATEDGVLMNASKTSIVAYPAGKAQHSYTVPSSVTKIGTFSFEGAEYLTSLTVASSVQSIEMGAFFGASHLTSVMIPDSVTSIGLRAFHGCDSLKTLYTQENSYAASYFESNYPSVAVVYTEAAYAGAFEISTEAYVLAETGKIAVKINLSKNSGLAGLSFKVGFNMSVLTLSDFTNGTIISGTTNLEDTSVTLSSVDHISYFYAGASNQTETGTLITLVFDKTGDFEQTALEITVNDIYDESYTNLVPLVSVASENIPGTLDATFLSCGGKFADESTSKTASLFSEFPAVTRSGYTFDGWYTAETGGTKISSGDAVSFAENQSFFAHWKANTYTLYFNANGGECSVPSKEVTVESTYGALPTPSRLGYAFDGWYTEAEGGDKISEEIVVSASAPQTLYAHWEADTYIVYFNANGGECSVESKDVTFGATYGSLPTPTHPGYAFEGWYTEAAGGDKVTESTAVSITASQTLYAHWKPVSYTVSFNANGGECSIETKNVTFGGTYGYLPTPTRNGFVFIGWYTSANAGEKVTSDTICTGTENHTLYAHWGSSAGDVNGDGRINIKDAILLAQYLASWGVEVDTVNADCNGDGNIDIRDAVLLSQYLAGWDVELKKKVTSSDVEIDIGDIF
ncbi:MAG: InlB B-repeat-containing protein [Eubacteriales bacterium]